ncbi:hypothetical protein BDR06DRAFT_974720 [Suillus hirtellus]|nr:hypothetical protein BDR06DRAFT_974720 [Suillus hirtellus]
MAMQPKGTVKGILETPIEVEKRLIMKKDETLKATHQMMRQRNKYRHREAVVDNLVKQMADKNEEDLPAWRWLQRLIRTLGEGAVEWEMDIVNHQRLMDDDIFTPQGSKPMKWIHAARNPMTSRAQVDGLPKVLYNKGWLAGLTKCQVKRLMILEKEFSGGVETSRETYMVFDMVSCEAVVKLHWVKPMQCITPSACIYDPFPGPWTMSSTVQMKSQVYINQLAISFFTQACLKWVTNWSLTCAPMYGLAEGILKDYPNLNMSLHHRASS